MKIGGQYETLSCVSSVNWHLITILEGFGQIILKMITTKTSGIINLVFYNIKSIYLLWNVDLVIGLALFLHCIVALGVFLFFLVGVYYNSYLCSFKKKEQQ